MQLVASVSWLMSDFSYMNDLIFNLFQGCGVEPTISKKSKNPGVKGHEAENALKNEENSDWRADPKKDGRCQFVIDLGCVKQIRSVKLRNSYEKG